MSLNKKLFLIFVVTIIPLINLTGQVNNLQFSHITANEGLSQSNVISILQDSHGFMWFGTFNGLNRYDGYQFEIFQHQTDNPQSISHNYISSIFEDHNQNLWIGTPDGLNLFDRFTNQFQTFKYDSDDKTSLSNNAVQVIYEDSQNKLWIGTGEGGLDLYIFESGKFIHHTYNPEDPKSLSSNFIRELYEDSRGNLWIGHGDGSIDIFDSERALIKRLLIHGSKITNSRITGFIEIIDDIFLISTQGDGIYKLKYKQSKPQILKHYFQGTEPYTISSNIVLDILLDAKGQIWIATEDDGINILNIKSDVFQYYRANPFDPTSLNYNSIWTIYEDNLGLIWLGTYAGGVNLFNDKHHNFKHYKNQPGKYNSLSSNMVTEFWEESYNQIWIATDGGGLNLLDRSQNSFIYYNTTNTNIATNVIISLYKDQKNRFWLGTWGHGLYQFDRKSNRLMNYSQEKNGLGSNNILDIVADDKGGLWLCTFWGGLTYFNPDENVSEVFNPQNSPISHEDARIALIDSKQHLWVGTDVGVDVMNLKTKTISNYFHNGNNPNSISKGFVHSIIETKDSTIFIGTAGGLNKYVRSQDAFIQYSTLHGLPDDVVKSIVEDDNGYLWIGTNKGLSRFDPIDESFRNFDIGDGLQGNEFNQMSSLKTSNGELLFGGINGFNIFNPKDFKDNPNIPPVFITDFKIFNMPVEISEPGSPLKKHIIETDKIELSYRHSVFSFEFVALNYILPEKNQYAYMMEGFEKNWNYIGSSRSATYTNLDPGEYTFRVKASNNDGLWNELGASIHIKINPPFWKTWWAYLIEAILFLVILFLIINYFISRQKLRNALRLEHLELENMYELDQKKTQLFNNISHEFNSPITLIMDPLEKLLKRSSIESSIRSKLELIHRNAFRLQRMINQLKDFQNIETGELKLHLSKGDIIQFVQNTANSFLDYAKDSQIEFTFQSDQNSYFAWFDYDKVDKIIYNLLSNAFKFTPVKGKIEISVSILSLKKITTILNIENKAEKYIEIIVKDTGIGIPQSKIDEIFKRFYHVHDYDGVEFEGSGIGLAFVYELIKLYQGDISVKSEEGKGAEFTVLLPIDEHYLEENQLVAEFNIDPIKSPPRVNDIAFKNKDSSADIINDINNQGQNVPVVLIIDDDIEVRRYIKEALSLNYRVIEAENGSIGLKIAKERIPDLIVSDIKMPELEGIDLCNKLKENVKTSHIPIILLTAYSSSDYRMKSLETGVDAYITKPFNVEELKAQIINLLKSRKKLVDKFSKELVLGPKKVVVKDIDAMFLNRIIEKVEEHMSDTSFNSETLAKEIGLSRMQLYRKVRGLTDQTVHEFIRSIRLKRAVQLLEERKMTITEIAYDVGFNDLTYFARCFRKEYNKSPSEFISTKKK